MRLLSGALHVAIGVALLGACGVGDREPTGMSRARIESGDADPGDAAVVAIGTRRPTCDGRFVPTCSGTLVAPRVVLTAAHCFADRAPGTTYEVYFGDAVGDAVGDAGAFRYAIGITSHPAFDPATDANDVAVLLLDAAAPALPAAMRTAPLDASFVGTTARIAGYGVAGDAGPGVRRQGTSTISSIDATSFRIVPSPALTCSGDSGGPAFSASGELIGITSNGDPGCAAYGIDTRVDAYVASFVQPAIDQSQAAATLPPPSLAPLGLCSVSCAKDADCPAGLACLVAPGGPRRCGVEGLLPGDLGGACHAGGDCASGTCARVAPGDDPGACRCAVACGAQPSGDGGCAIASGVRGAGGASITLFFALALVRRRQRRRGRMTACA